MKSSLKLFTIVIPLAGSLLFPWIGKAQAPTPPYVVMPGGNQVQVERILARPDGSLVVTRNGQPVNLTPEQYERAVGERPPELARAEELMAGGEADQAEDLLEEVLRKAAFQSWDGIAAARLAEMRLKAGNPIGARRPLDTLRSRYGDNTERFFPEVEFIQWKTRVASGQTEGLEEELTEVIRGNTARERKGMAQLVRGDLKKQRGDKQEAVLDYLRTIYFFGGNRELHEEALYKSADTFAELGDSARSRTFAQTLKQSYPDSEYVNRPLGN